MSMPQRYPSVLYRARNPEPVSEKVWQEIRKIVFESHAGGEQRKGREWRTGSGARAGYIDPSTNLFHADRRGRK